MVESEAYGDYWQCPLTWIAPQWAMGDINYLSDGLLPDVVRLAALQTAPIKPDGDGIWQKLDLSSLGPAYSNAMTFWGSDESKIRSRDTALMLAKDDLLKKLKAEGKLSFDFKVSRVHSINLQQH